MVTTTNKLHSLKLFAAFCYNAPHLCSIPNIQQQILSKCNRRRSNRIPCKSYGSQMKNKYPASQPARTCVRAREREKTRGNSGPQTISSFRRPPGALPGVLQVVAVGMNSKRRNLSALWFWMTYFIQLSLGQYFIHYCMGWQILKDCTYLMFGTSLYLFILENEVWQFQI